MALCYKGWVTLLGCVLWLVSFAVSAQQVRVEALFPDKALLSIDGTSRVLKVGQTSRDGVTLVAADSEQAIIRVGDRQQALRIGQHIGGYRAQDPQLTLARDAIGMYRTPGRINGQQVQFLVDTGATKVAMSGVLAQELGISVEGLQRYTVVTAGGERPAYQVLLEDVSVGDITLYAVEAVVLEGAYPDEVLLGMSFLNRVSLEYQGSILTIKK